MPSGFIAGAPSSDRMGVFAPSVKPSWFMPQFEANTPGHVTIAKAFRPVGRYTITRLYSSIMSLNGKSQFRP